MSVKKLANPNAHANNMFIAHMEPLNCPCDGLETCLYRAYAPDGVTNISSISYKNTAGSTAVKSITVDNVNKVKSIKNAIESLGFDPDYEDNYISVQIVDNFIMIIGDLVLVSITVDGDVLEFEKTCEKGKICEGTGAIEVGATIDVTYGELTAEVTMPATGNLATAKSNLKTALDEAGIPNYNIRVVENDGVYIFNVDTEGDASLMAFDGLPLLHCKCRPHFTGLDYPVLAGPLVAPGDLSNETASKTKKKADKE